jgi:replicative DNA helicase
MIDYVGLLVPSALKDNMHEKGKAIAEELISLGEQHDAAVIAAAQTTKGAVSLKIEDIDESHIGGSFALQQVAYDVIMLSKAQNALLSNKVHTKWVKNRSGGKLGITSLYEIPNTFKLTDDINEMFALSKKVGIQLLPEEVDALVQNNQSK